MCKNAYLCVLFREVTNETLQITPRNKYMTIDLYCTSLSSQMHVCTVLICVCIYTQNCTSIAIFQLFIMEHMQGLHVHPMCLLKHLYVLASVCIIACCIQYIPAYGCMCILCVSVKLRSDIKAKTCLKPQIHLGNMAIVMISCANVPGGKTNI